MSIASQEDSVAGLPRGPEGFPALRLLRWMWRPLSVLRESAEQYGDTFTMRVTALPPVVVTSAPDHVRALFADDGSRLSAGEANRVLEPFLGSHSLLVLDGPTHTRERKLLMPPLHGERLEAHGHSMLSAAHEAIDAWPMGEPFVLQTSMQQVTLRVILRTVFGFEESGTTAELFRRMRGTLELGAWPPLLLPVMQKDLGPWSPWGKFVRARDGGDHLLFAEMKRRRAEGTAGRNDVLSLLLDARDEDGKPMTDHELRDELTTLLVAGHETTATALSWTFWEILGRPDVLARLRKELEGNEEQPDKLHKLPYLDAVVRESLRLHPVVPAVGRVVKKPFKMGPYTLPTGTLALASIYLSSRRPELYADPERFDPDRFMERKFTPQEWFPFGGGIRRCIGMAFALYEMKMVLAAILSRAELERAPHVPAPKVVRRAVTLGPSSGVPVVLRSRSSKNT